MILTTLLLLGNGLISILIYGLILCAFLYVLWLILNAMTFIPEQFKKILIAIIGFIVLVAVINHFYPIL